MSTTHSTNELGILLLRVSDDRQSGHEAQTENVRRLARVHNVRIVEEVFDEGESGDNLGRPGIERVEEITQRHHRQGTPVRWIFADKSDRVSRADSIDTYELLAGLRRDGVRWIATPAKLFDLRNKMDRTLLALECDHKNNANLKDVARTVLDGMLAAARAGFWTGGPVPLGYRLVKTPGEHGTSAGGTRKRRCSGRLGIDESTAPVVVEAFERFADGESTREVTLFLSRATGRTWTRRGAVALLKNEIYTGVRPFGARSRGKHAALSDGHATELLDDDQGRDVVKLRAYPRLIDDHLFLAVRARFVTAPGRSRRKDRPPSALAGLCRCGICGHVLKGSSSGGRPYFRCAGGDGVKDVGACRAAYRNRDELTRRVLAVLADDLLEGDAAATLVRKAAEVADEERRRWRASARRAADALSACDEHLAKARRRLAVADDDMIEEYQLVIRELKEERAGLEAQVRESAAAEPVEGEDDVRRVERWLENCRAAVAYGADADGARLNALLADLVCEVKVFPPPVKKAGGATVGRIEVILPGWLSRALSHPGNDGCPSVPGYYALPGPSASIVLVSDGGHK